MLYKRFIGLNFECIFGFASGWICVEFAHVAYASGRLQILRLLILTLELRDSLHLDLLETVHARFLKNVLHLLCLGFQARVVMSTVGKGGVRPS